MDCMRQYLQDAIEYIGDLHTLTKVKVSRWLPLHLYHPYSIIH